MRGVELLLVGLGRCGVSRVRGGRDDGGNIILDALHIRHGLGHGSLGVVGILGVNDDEQGTVGTGAEVLGDQVVGNARSAAVGGSPVIGQGELHRRDRDRDDAGNDEAGHERHGLVLRDEVCPATARGALVRTGLGITRLEEGQLSRSDPAAGEAEQCGEQGQGNEDGHRDGRCRGQTHLCQERDVDDGEAGERDDHREPGEDDR